MTFLRRLLRARRMARRQAACANAQARHDAARTRGDTRAQHTTLKALQDATHALMRAEVGR